MEASRPARLARTDAEPPSSLIVVLATPGARRREGPLVEEGARPSVRGAAEAPSCDHELRWPPQPPAACFWVQGVFPFAQKGLGRLLLSCALSPPACAMAAVRSSIFTELAERRRNSKVERPPSRTNDFRWKPRGAQGDSEPDSGSTTLPSAEAAAAAEPAANSFRWSRRPSTKEFEDQPALQGASSDFRWRRRPSVAGGGGGDAGGARSEPRTRRRSASPGPRRPPLRPARGFLADMSFPLYLL